MYQLFQLMVRNSAIHLLQVLTTPKHSFPAHRIKP